MKKIILIGLVALLAVFVVADEYYTPLTLEEFSNLNDTQLTSWNATLQVIQEEGQDEVYYFLLNTYFLWTDEDDVSWVVPTRATFYTQCYEELNCTAFYDEELNNIMEYEFSYFKEIQSEYEP